MQSFLRKYQIVIFFLLALIIGWSPWYTGSKGFIPGAVSIAGLLMIILTGGRTGLAEALKKTLRCKAGLKWYLLPLLLPAVMGLLALGVNLLLGGKMPGFPFLRYEWRLIPLFLLHNLHPLGGPVGEEIFGFRGYALPRLQEKYGPLLASIIIGSFFGFWHLPEFLRPGSSQFAMGFAAYVPFILAEIGWSILMTWVYNKTNESVIISGILFHLMFNFWSCVLMTDFTHKTIDSFPALDQRLLFANFFLIVLTALIVAICTKGLLGKTKSPPSPMATAAVSR